MKTMVSSVAIVFIGVITVLQGTVQAQEVPRLRQKMPYAQARKILLNAGWQAIEIPVLQRDPFRGTVEYIVKGLGYNEVVDCSGTGRGFCRFEFGAADGRKLVVITVNNQRGRQPILSHWLVEKNL